MSSTVAKQTTTPTTPKAKVVATPTTPKAVATTIPVAPKKVEAAAKAAPKETAPKETAPKEAVKADSASAESLPATPVAAAVAEKKTSEKKPKKEKAEKAEKTETSAEKVPKVKAEKKVKAVSEPKPEKVKAVKKAKAEKKAATETATATDTETATDSEMPLGSGKRTFKIFLAEIDSGSAEKTHIDSKTTKSRLVGKTPKQAANKALTALLRIVNKGKSPTDSVTGTDFSASFTIRETTRGSKGKEYMYFGKREKLASPSVYSIKVDGQSREIVNNYRNVVVKVVQPSVAVAAVEVPAAA